MNLFSKFFKKDKISVSYNKGILICNNVTADEIKKKIEELRQTYSEETVWSKIAVLYNCKYISLD